MNPLDAIINDINKNYKENIIQVGTDRIYVEKIPFSSPKANYISYGGIPIGKATEFFGPEGGGKTTASLDVTGQAQKKAKVDWVTAINTIKDELGPLEEKNNKSDKDKIKKLKEKLEDLEEKGPRRAVYVDAENTLDEEWAQKNGVDTDELYLVRPQNQTAEQVLQMMLDIIGSGQVEIIVLDSIPMLISQQLFDQTLEKKSYAGVAGAMTEFTRKASPLISKHHTALVMINQVRDDIDNPYNQYNTPGGRALRHFYALRFFCRKGTYLDEKNQELANNAALTPAGNKADLKIIKTKVCKPDRLVGQYTINYTKGIDVLSDTIDMAIKYDIIVQAGAWYRLVNPETGEILESNDGELKFQGRPKLLEYLTEDEEMFDEIYEAVNVKLLDGDTA